MIPANMYFLMADACRSNANYIGGTPVGAVLVKNGSIISMGWNSFPPEANVEFLNSLGRKERAQFVIHAEVNALLTAARNGICTNNGEMFITRFPCIHCITKMIKAGVKKIHFLNEKELDSRWESRYLFTLANTGMEFIEYDKDLMTPKSIQWEDVDAKFSFV